MLINLKVSLLLLLLGSAFAQFTYNPIKPSSIDPSSYANVEVIQTTNFDLAITVDFDQSSVYGTNILTLKAIQDVSQIILDI